MIASNSCSQAFLFQRRLPHLANLQNPCLSKPIRFGFPRPVSSALNILYHEKMRRGDFFDESDYDPDVVRIATGERDKAKQDAVYVRIDRSGRVRSTPLSVTLEAAKAEYEKAGRYQWLVTSLATDGPRDSEQFRKLREAMKIVYWQKYIPITPPTNDLE